MLSSLLNYFFLNIPVGVDKAHRRFYQFLTYIILLSGIGHALFVPLFFLLGVPSLVYYNILSVSLFFLVFALNRRGLHYLAMILMVAEYSGHASLAVHYVGWQFGFQYYMIGWAFVPWLAPRGHKPVKFGIFLVSCAMVTGLYAYSVSRPVPEAWNAFIVNGINAFNVTFNAGVLAFAFFYFRTLVDRAEDSLEREFERSEELLRNMLPDKIALRLKNDSRSVAENFEEVSVMFLDIVNFTPLAESMLPASVVRMLGDIFSRLDALADRYGLEKIKTIGDAYMVAAGIPDPMPNHYEAIANFALEADTVLKGYLDREGAPLQFRIGLNSGPIVAGVIGQRKFSYDLWGDTVNTAARMESHGLSGRIQVTRAFKELAQDEFKFERRGIVEIKGKGQMETFFLVGHNPQTLNEKVGTEPVEREQASMNRSGQIHPAGGEAAH